MGEPEIALLVVQMVRGLEIGSPKSYPHSYPLPTLCPLPPHSWLRQEERGWWCAVRVWSWERTKDQTTNLLEADGRGDHKGDQENTKCEESILSQSPGGKSLQKEDWRTKH